MPKQEDAAIDIRPQRDNINRHTERGQKALEETIQSDGWIGAITVAADGEAFDGSQRLETSEAVGLTSTRYVRTDGSERVIIVRTDIPNATDDKARRLGIAANRVSELDYNPDPFKLAQAAREDLLESYLYTPSDVEALLAAAPLDPLAPPPGNGGDEWLWQPHLDAPTRVKRGELWQIGPHRLFCGSATDPADMDALLHDRRPVLHISDPPYNIGKEYADGIDDNLSDDAYTRFIHDWFEMWDASCQFSIVTPGLQNLGLWMAQQAPSSVGVWFKVNAMSGGRVSAFNVWEPVLFFGDHWKRDRASDLFNHRVMEQRMENGQSLTGLHPCPKPVSLWSDLIESYTSVGDLVVDPMSGSGTTLITAHRTARVALVMDLSPHYCDLQLSRAEAEGIGPIHRVE